MKILLTGGGTGGHFYPIIAVAEKLNRLSEQQKIIKLDMIYMSDSPYDKNLLLQLGIRYKYSPAGKMRRYFSLANIVDVFKMAAGVIKSVWSIFFDFPDIVFSKGGYAIFPVLLAARLFGIPVVVHESDSVPGLVNKWSGKFAKRVGISFPDTGTYFPAKKVALVGTPIREEFFVRSEGAQETWSLESSIPVIFVVGGSQGSQTINNIILDVLPDLVKEYQVVHMCGKNNFEEIKGRAALVLENSEYKSRHHLFDFMDLTQMRMAYGVANLIISRAGSTAIFEIAATGVPSILIPLDGAAQDHQKKNAYAYAKAGACDVMEESNLTAGIMKSEIGRLFADKEKMRKMSDAAKKFARPDAAEKIAQEIINIALEHA